MQLKFGKFYSPESVNNSPTLVLNGSTFNIYSFLTAKEAVQQSIRLICLFVCLSVCHNLEILLLKGLNQQIRAKFDTTN